MAEYVNKKLLKRSYAWWIEDRAEMKNLFDYIIEQQPVVVLPEWRTGKTPKKDGTYIVTIDGASLATTLEYDSELDVWLDENGNSYNVKAWQPMPAAYK